MNKIKFLGASKYSPYNEFLSFNGLHAHMILHFSNPLMIDLISLLNFLINN